MPELPEVETTKVGIAPHIENQKITDVVVRQSQLRWPVPRGLKAKLSNLKVHKVLRRAKYLMLETDVGYLMLHLGMSGKLAVVDKSIAVKKHDHFDLAFANGKILRLNDPRRFGSIHWTQEPATHKLIKNLGPEPLSREFTGEFLHNLARARKANIKSVIMNSHIVVGVGNIYACEALFLTNIHPQQPASSISLEQYIELVKNIKSVLKKSIKAGGTTLKDFLNADGKPGYFSQKLFVYGRENQPCLTCGQTIQNIRLNQRSTFFCPDCQPLS